MLKYTTSLLLLLCSLSIWGQQKGPIDLQPKDTTLKTDPYGIRLGIDLSKPITSFFDEDYQGLEVVGDYRVTQKLYLAAELGNENYTQQEDLYNYTTKGSYLKLGVDYNTYENWYGMNNSIFIGGRYSVASFSQTLNNYQIYGSNRYWETGEFPEGTKDYGEFSGRTASWLEAVLGIKAELFAHIYLGASVRIGLLVGDKASEEFPNLWIPGFHKVTEGSRFGTSYNYTLTYFLPLYKKKKAKKAEKEE